MGRSDRLKLSDVEAVFELVQECRELWADARAWQSHLLRGACSLTGTTVGIYNELRVSADCTRSVALDESDFGWRDEHARAAMGRMYTDHPDRAAFMPRLTRMAGATRQGQDAAALRHEMRGEQEWRLSTMLNEYRRPAFLEDFIVSFSFNRATSSIIMLCTNQDLSEPAPTPRGKAILSLLNRRIAPLVGTALVTNAQYGVHRLSPRLRHTLQGILAGESEKQIAARLGISRATLHEYVGNLYSRFDVQGRSELMAFFVSRRPDGQRYALSHMDQDASIPCGVESPTTCSECRRALDRVSH